MKTKTTKKKLDNMYDLIIKVPYCKLQNVLDDLQPNLYNAGVNGWNYDIYDVEVKSYKVAICAGCRPIGIELLTDFELCYIDTLGIINVEEGYNELIRIIEYKLNME